MNYLSHYNLLIARSRERTILSGVYFERHHIIPRCMGGQDTEENIVFLFPEEHFVAHQLLVKIHPDNNRLVNAAIMMTRSIESQVGRSKNKLFGWLRKRLADANRRSMSGTGNSRYGTAWIYNPQTNISTSVKKELIDGYISDGWLTGRGLKKLICKNCGIDFYSKKSKKKTCNEYCARQLVSVLSRRNSKCVEDDDGIRYNSLSDAARSLNVDVETVRYRIKIGRYKDLSKNSHYSET